MAIADNLREAADRFGRGDIAGARAKAEAALAIQPENPAALQFLGVICCQAGDVNGGSEYFRRALHADPGSAEARFNLAKALLDLGRLDEAEQLCSQSGAASPEFLRLRAEIAKAQSRIGDSIRAYERVVQLSPADYEAWNNLGNARLESGDAEQALAAFRRAAQLKPAEPRIHLNLGRALAAAGHHEESVASFAEAARLVPNEAGLHLDHGTALNRVGRHADALIALSTAARLNPRDPEIFVALGLTFASLGEFDRAEEGYRVALHVDTRYPPAFLNLGILLEQANRTEELEELLQDAQLQRIEADEILYLRALLLRRQGDLAQALVVASSLSGNSVDAGLRAQLVGQLADRLGDADTAFAAFEAMNRATAADPSAASFDGSEHRHYVEGLIGLATKPWYSRWPSVELPNRPASPVFLVGFPRSGTTLLDTVLMGHPGTHVLEEEALLPRLRDQLGGLQRLGEAGNEEINALRSSYFAQLETISPPPSGSLVIDKLPLNTLQIPLIHRLFPDARIIFAQRHPCDVVLSCFMQNFKINRAMASFLTLENAALLYDRVLTFWEQCRQVFPLNVHIVRYEAMVADLEAEVRPLLEFLDLPWTDAILDYRQTAADRGRIRTPSYAQVTEVIYERSSGRWERYRDQMQDILPILAPWAERLGYGPLTSALRQD